MKYFNVIVICALLYLLMSSINADTFAEDTTIPQLLEQLNNNDYEVKKEAIHKLHNIGQKEPLDDEVFKALVYLLNDSEWRIRVKAVMTMEYARNKEEAISALISALNDESYVVKVYAIKILGRIGDERAIKPISLLLNDPEESVREMAKKALDSLKK